MADKQYVRVEDPETGHKFSVATVFDERLKVLKSADATDHRGRPLPPEHKAPKDTKARPASSPASQDESPKEAN